MINFRQIVHPLQKIFPELMVKMGYIKVQVKVFGRVNRMENPYESNGIRSPGYANDDRIIGFHESVFVYDFEYLEG